MKHRLILLIVFVIASPFAWAHKITVDALYDDGKVYLECWLGTNEPAADASLEVTNVKGEVIHTGQLDQDGTYVYTPTSAETLTFSVDANLGHKGTAALDLTGQVLPSASQASSTVTPFVEPTPSSESIPPVTDSDMISPPSPYPAKPSLRSSQGGLTTGERVILGLICIASLASAYLSYRNQARIAALEEKLRARNLDSR